MVATKWEGGTVGEITEVGRTETVLNKTIILYIENIYYIYFFFLKYIGYRKKNH